MSGAGIEQGAQGLVLYIASSGDEIRSRTTLAQAVLGRKPVVREAARPLDLR
jgi:hypothetical protein